ncbi:glycoside hydrolase family 47 protein [Mycena belliarum]|uniref:alpha-1,2-Mannosidase n=1 Tax=Mycena belliarum TaxID=1033014 RepID=A0AAD6XJ96_9AGAR|nr:glycoside hydrolase family 47 protein [Mycena belliae]
MHLPYILTLLGLSSRALAGVTVQKPGLKVPAKYASNRAAAQKIFTDSYTAYKKFAFGHDELLPVSNSFTDDLGGWGASLVDAMGTMLVMGLDDLFTEALNFTSQTDFSTPPEPGLVSVFETTIRFVGGMLSAYELSGQQHSVLVDKAKQVADKLAFAWVDDNTIPYGHIDFPSNTPNIAVTNIAEAGTLSLEWTLLSQFTGNATYGKLVTESVLQILGLATPLPGLAPQNVDPATGEFVGQYLTWGGGSDSYFEYLLKFARFTNTNNTIFIDTWKTAVDSSIRHLLETSTVGDHFYLADNNGGENIHVGSHLACFFPGNWLLGGKLLQNQTIIDFALKLNDGCWNTYASTQTGIGPEGFAYISPDGNFTDGGSISADQLAFNKKHGFYITSSDYIQRPEVLESNFHAWRITGDTKYLDRAAAAIKSFNTFLRVNNAYASLNDVDNTGAGRIDITESFWFAEVLKYLYLTFDDPSHISLDDYVLNTECHPLRAPPALASYGSGSFTPAQKPFTAHTASGPLPAISPI